MISDGTIDAVVVDYRIGTYVIAENKIRDIRVIGEPIAHSYSSFAVKKGNIELLNEINHAMMVIKHDGTYDSILKDWEPTDVVFFTKEQISLFEFVSITSALLLLLVITAMWIVTLKKELHKRRLSENALHRLNRELRAISDCNQVLVRAKDEQTLLKDICHIICEKAGYRMAWVGYAENDEAKTVRPVAWGGVEDGYVNMAHVTWADTELGRGPSGTAVRSGASACIQDFATDPNAVPWRENALQRGYRSSIALPLKRNHAPAFGALTIYSMEANAFTPDEIRLLEELADDLAFGIYVQRERKEHKLAEERLLRSEQGLAEAQRIAHLGSWELDLQNNILSWSDEIFRISEIDPEKFGASYDAFLNVIHPEDRDLANTAYTDSIRDKTPYDIVHRLRMPDGRIKYVHEKCETHYGADGIPLRFVGTVHDITERKLAEEELRKYKDSLEEQVQQRTADLILARNAAEAANLAKSVFLANMSHELRTPLNAILGFSSLMRKDPLIPEGERQNIDIINRSGEHLLSLINDILEVAKIEAGRLQLEDAPFDLGRMVRDVTEMMQIRANEKHLTLVVDQSSAFPRYIVGDEARLRQVLINLVGNALKFTQHGGVTIRLGTRNNATSHLLIAVEDTGIGIAPEDQHRIFEPFVQLGQLANNKGTGLGLTITRQFIQLMGGTLTLESAPGKGSVFRADLPLKQAREEEINGVYNSESREVVGLAPGQPEYRILIVEDQLENQMLLSKLMETVGFQVKVAENGKKGIELFQSWNPHLIWMDRRMPVMDGIEATKVIRDLPRGSQVKIVAVTASAFEEQRTEILAAGTDDFVRKPYRANEIYDCLAKNLSVKYVYADSQATSESDVKLVPEMLLSVPQDLRAELLEALESLDSEHIGIVVRKVAPYDENLRKTLHRLADNFEYDVILKALRTLSLR